MSCKACDYGPDSAVLELARAVRFFNENGGVENMLVEIDTILLVYPQYTQKKWLFLEIMRDSYCKGYIGEDIDEENYYEEMKEELMWLILFLKKEAFNSGWKDNLKDNYVSSDTLKILEKFLEEIKDVDLSSLLEESSNECECECETNFELIAELDNLDKAENCFPCPNTSGFNLCKQPYALCTSAKCIASPANPDMVICYCDVLRGCSLGTQACDTLKPFRFKGFNIVFSTFSPIQLAKDCNKAIEYPNELNPTTEFANCLNQICIVDPANKKKAICFCPTSFSDPWYTIGNKVNTNPNIVLSGATESAFNETGVFYQDCKGITI